MEKMPEDHPWRLNNGFTEFRDSQSPPSPKIEALRRRCIASLKVEKKQADLVKCVVANLHWPEALLRDGPKQRTTPFASGKEAAEWDVKSGYDGRFYTPHNKIGNILAKWDKVDSAALSKVADMYVQAPCCTVREVKASISAQTSARGKRAAKRPPPPPPVVKVATKKPRIENEASKVPNSKDKLPTGQSNQTKTHAQSEVKNSSAKKVPRGPSPDPFPSVDDCSNYLSKKYVDDYEKDEEKFRDNPRVTMMMNHLYYNLDRHYVTLNDGTRIFLCCNYDFDDRCQLFSIRKHYASSPVPCASCKRHYRNAKNRERSRQKKQKEVKAPKMPPVPFQRNPYVWPSHLPPPPGKLVCAFRGIETYYFHRCNSNS